MTSLFIWTFFLEVCHQLFFPSRGTGRRRCEADDAGLQHGEGDYWHIEEEYEQRSRNMNVLDRVSSLQVRSPRWQKRRTLKLLEDGVTIWCQSQKTSSRAKEQQSCK